MFHTALQQVAISCNKNFAPLQSTGCHPKTVCGSATVASDAPLAIESMNRFNWRQLRLEDLEVAFVRCPLAFVLGYYS